MKAYLILVGTELLNGAMLDTNSIYMADELNKLSIEVVGKLACMDRVEDIVEAIAFARSRSDVVILSGGLGPTIDDLTKDAISKYLEKDLIVDDFHKKEMEKKFFDRGIKVLEKNIKEVMVIKDSIVFYNEPGIAPGFYIDNIAAFPGVPRELKNLFPKFLEYIKEEKSLKNPLVIRDLIVFGIPESILEAQIIDLFKDNYITIEFLVKDYGIIVRLIGDYKKEMFIESKIEAIKKILGKNLISTDARKIEDVLVEKLKDKNYNIKVAESCTGGMIASTLVALPGVSSVFEEGYITYSNEAKEKILGVKKETLTNYGAVSKETVTEMLLGLDSDTAIAVSGIAGPGGGTKEKPVGTVYIGVKVREDIRVERYEIKGERERIRQRSCQQALFNLLNMFR